MTRAAILFVFVGPVVELGVGPFVLTGFEVGDDLPGAWALRAAGGVLLAVGIALSLAAMHRLRQEGEGTPSPLAPATRPVRGGIYGVLRHPMYTGTTLGLVGEALLLRQAILLAAAGLFALTMTVLVWRFEEPQLRQRFGERWRSEREGS